MMLLDEDVSRIKELGYEESDFATWSDGFRILKNSREDRCVFHDGKQCTIYENRPAGCKLYPVIYDEDLKLAMKDIDCPYRNEFNLSRKCKRELSSVYSRLITEKRERSDQNS
jgi:uncharacterized protein